MKDFAELYNNAPKDIQGFLYSDDFWSFVDEAEKKFSITEEQNLAFVYLLEDFAIGATGGTGPAGFIDSGAAATLSVRADALGSGTGGSAIACRKRTIKLNAAACR